MGWRSKFSDSKFQPPVRAGRIHRIKWHRSLNKESLGEIGGAILDEEDAEQTATEARASAKEVETVRAAVKVPESELAQTQRDSASVN